MLLGVCFFFDPFEAYAVPQLGFYTQWNDRILDDPDRALAEAHAEFARLSPEKNPDEWIQLMVLLSRIDWNGPWMTSDPKAMLENGRGIAEEHEYPDLGLMLEYLQEAKITHPAGDFQEVRKNFLLYIQKSEDLKLSFVSALLASDLAYFEYEQGDIASALVWSKKSLSAILQVRGPLDFITLDIKNTMAIILEYIGNSKQTGEIYEDLETLLRQRYLRSSLATVLCNHALLLLHDNVDLPGATARYQEALKIAGELNNQYLIALSRQGLAKVFLIERQWPQALKELDLGIETLRKNGFGGVLLSEFYLLKAKAFSELGQWSKALEATALSETPQSKQDKRRLIKIRHLMAQSYAGLGQYEKAYAAQKESFELADEFRENERKNETAKLHIQLGLDLQEQKNVALENEISWQRRTFFIVSSLAFVILILLGLALRNAREAHYAKRRIQNILDNIEQGLVTIGKGMQVEVSLSPFIHKLLKSDSTIPPKEIFPYFMSVLDLNTEEKAAIRSTLSICLQDDRLTWELNAAQLPEEISIFEGRQWLGLHWQAIFNDRDQVKSILLVLRDTTEARRLRSEKEKTQREQLEGERRIQELLTLNPRDARGLIHEFQAAQALLLDNLFAEKRMTECLRALHTCKGLARTLGIKELSLVMHEIEDQIDTKLGTIRNMDLMRQRFDHLNAVFSDYQKWVNRLFPSHGQAEDAAITLHEQIGRHILAIQKHLASEGIALGSFQIDDGILEWSQPILKKIDQIVMHGLTNSIDHGFIFPTRAGETVAQPVFVIEARLVPSGYRIRLMDNGAGLNIPKLQMKAERSGLADWREVLFQSGMSTADEVSATSGRGVGLSAIRDITLELGGQVRLEPREQGSGTCLEIIIPHNHQDLKTA